MSSDCDFAIFNNSTGIMSDELVSKAMQCVFDTNTSDLESVKTMNLINNHILPKYEEKTNTMMLMNSSYNSSTYIKEDLDSKRAEVEHINALARKNIHKVRYSYLQKRRETAYYRFMSGVIQSLILIIAVSAILIAFYKMGKLSPILMGACIVSIVAIFLIVIAIIIKNNLTRRPDDWSKFYFAPTRPDTK